MIHKEDKFDELGCDLVMSKFNICSTLRDFESFPPPISLLLKETVSIEKFCLIHLNSLIPIR